MSTGDEFLLAPSQRLDESGVRPGDGEGAAYAGADHGEWTVRAYDDQPVAEGKKYPANLTVKIAKSGQPWREFLFPSYKIWTLLAHWTEDLDVLEEAGPDPALAAPVAEPADVPAGHRYHVVDGNGGQWLCETTDEYPEPTPIGRVDDILRRDEKRDREAERLKRVKRHVEDLLWNIERGYYRYERAHVEADLRFLLGVVAEIEGA